jgi:serpin B
VSQVVTSTVVKVDEKGTTAAAATGGVASATAAEEVQAVMDVDRPFLAVISDAHTGLPLFVLQVRDPVAVP